MNNDGTLAVRFADDGVRNIRVPRAHIHDLGFFGIQVGQMVSAKSEIPVQEFAQFTAGFAYAIQPRTYTSKEVIVAKDSQAEGMFLVDRGIVASCGSLFTKGAFFCREGIVFTGTTDREYRSVTYVTVNLITKESVEKMLETKQFPAIAYWLQRLKVRLAFTMVGRMAIEYNEFLAGGPATVSSRCLDLLVQNRAKKFAERYDNTPVPGENSQSFERLKSSGPRRNSGANATVIAVANAEPEDSPPKPLLQPLGSGRCSPTQEGDKVKVQEL